MMTTYTRILGIYFQARSKARLNSSILEPEWFDIQRVSRHLSEKLEILTAHLNFFLGTIIQIKNR